MIESTTSTTGTTMAFHYTNGAANGVITIDRHRVGEFSFVDNRSLEQFMTLMRLAVNK